MTVMIFGDVTQRLNEQVGTLVPPDQKPLPQEVKGLEYIYFGRISNVAGDIYGVALGIANLSDKDFKGFGLGLLNRADKMTGVQMAFWGNNSDGDMRGVQVAFLGNGSGGDMTGAQVALLANSSGGDMRGFQVSGVNGSYGDMTGIQAAAVANSSLNGDMTGIQAAFVNISFDGAMTGVQVAGVMNYSKRGMTGVHVAGMNSSGSGMTGVQAALVTNTSCDGDMTGVQVALVNISLGDMTGFQVAGVNATSGDMDGFKMGLVNYAGGKMDGVGLGVVNSWRSGQCECPIVNSFCIPSAFPNPDIRKAQKIFDLYIEGVWALGSEDDYKALIGDGYIKDEDEYWFWVDIFGRGEKGGLTESDHNQIWRRGYSTDLIDELRKLCGKDGNEGARMRLDWLKDNVDSRWYRRDYADELVQEMNKEIKEIERTL